MKSGNFRVFALSLYLSLVAICPQQLFADSGSRLTSKKLPVSEKILGGSHVDLQQTEVALIYGSFFSCSGLLVGQQEVLTAAHCIIDTPANYSVFLGRQRYGVKEVRYNPRYDLAGSASIENSQHDIGMLVLDSPVQTFSPVPVVYDYPLALGDRLTTFGYGINESSNNQTYAVDRAKAAVVTVEEIGSGMFLSSHDGSSASTCEGDSGGPSILFFDENILGAVGTTSAGTNGDSSGQCILGGPGISLFVDLQSQSSQDFLSQFPGVEWLSGRTAAIFIFTRKVATQIVTIGKSKSLTKLKKSLNSTIKVAQALKSYSDGSRKGFLSSALSNLMKASKAKSLSAAKAAIKKALASLNKVLALGLS